LDRASGFNFNRVSQEDAYPDKTDVRFSPRIGFVYTPVPSTDVFASFATSFKPNVFGTDDVGNAFDAETGDQIEVGVRHELVPDRLRAQAAVFRVEKRHVVVYEPPDFRAAHSGTRESTGFEAELIGSPIPGWTVTGGYAFIDATITEDSDPANVGARLFGVPRHQAHLWTKYEVPSGRAQGLSFGYGVFSVGERAANEPASLMLPGHTRHDVMAGYGRGRLAGQLNVENLADTRIYDTHGFLIYPRDGIAVRASLRVTF
jgi:iron complex outermembrane receptor protein